MHELFGINFWISNSVVVVQTHSGNGLYAYALPNGNNKRGYRNIRHPILLQFYFPLQPITSSIHPILEWNLSSQVAGTLCKFFPGSIVSPYSPPSSTLLKTLKVQLNCHHFRKCSQISTSLLTLLFPFPHEFELPVYHLAQLSLCLIIRACLCFPYQISATGRQKYNDMRH